MAILKGMENMLNPSYTFIFAIINLLVLYYFLKKFLFKPVTSFMDNRTRSIREALENAEKAKAQGEQLKLEYEQQLQNSRQQAEKIVGDARLRGQKEYDEIVQSAHKSAGEILDQARASVERERQEMLKEIGNQVASLALAAASKVIEANMDNERNREIVQKFIDEEGAA